MKALKEHYSAPKKQAPLLMRRTSVVDALDSPATPSEATEAQMVLRNLGKHSDELRRRAGTPKWEAEIDKVREHLWDNHPIIDEENLFL